MDMYVAMYERVASYIEYNNKSSYCCMHMASL